MGENFFSIIFYSFYIFEGNYRDFKDTVQSYIKLTTRDNFVFDEEKHNELSIQGSRELSRLIHNYAAAWFSLVDHTRATQEKLKEHNEEAIRSFALEYEQKLKESLKDSVENWFVKDLRRYVQHKAVPVPTLIFRIKRINSSTPPSESPLAEMSYSFELSSQQIKDFNWSTISQKYIENNDSIPFVEIIDKHFGMMKEFYHWIQFRDHQLHPYAPNSIKQCTFEEWMQQYNNV